MRYSFSLFFFLTIIFYTNLRCEAQVQFPLEAKLFRIKKEFFDSVIVLDKRADTTAALGNIMLHYKRGFEKIVPEKSLSEDFRKLYQQITSREVHRTLVVVIYEFNIEEKVSDIDVEIAGFRYSADYFVSQDDGTYSLQHLVDLDTFVRAYDVTNLLLTTANKTLNFCLNQVPQKSRAVARSFALADLYTLKPNDVQYFAPYAPGDLIEGVYDSWNDFLCGHPNDKFVIGEHYNGLSIFKKVKNNLRYIPNAKEKIIVHNGNCYLHDNGRFMDIRKDSSGFWVTKKMILFDHLKVRQEDPKQEKIAGAMFGTFIMTMLFPLSSTLVIWYNPFKLGKGKIYDCILNPRTGKLLPIREHVSIPHKKH